MNSCVDRVKAGGSCGSDGDCELSAVCQTGSCKRNNGAACQLDGECVSGSCLQTCQAPQKAGSRCDTEVDCVASTRCVTGSCRAMVGATCGSDPECETHYCSTASRVCMTPVNLANGESCTDDTQCATGSCGWERKCATQAARLENCNSDPDCMGTMFCYRTDPTSNTGYCQDASTN
jgi:hypothetical protein